MIELWTIATKSRIRTLSFRADSDCTAVQPKAKCTILPDVNSAIYKPYQVTHATILNQTSYGPI